MDESVSAQMLEQVCAAVARLELTAELCRRIIDKAPEYGEAAAVHGVRQVLERLGLSAALARIAS
jgi:hypothetical protein